MAVTNSNKWLEYLKESYMYEYECMYCGTLCRSSEGYTGHLNKCTKRKQAMSELAVKKGTNTMKITLKNGVVVEGTLDQIKEVAKTFGVNLNSNEYYLSETHGLMRIAEMDKQHLRNAALKMYRTWLDGLKLVSDSALLTAFASGPNDPTFLALVAALATRK